MLAMYLVLFQLVLLGSAYVTAKPVDCNGNNGANCTVGNGNNSTEKMGCSPNCKRAVFGGKVCNNETEECYYGCKTGFMGISCSHQCSNGTYGDDCSRFCSIHCADQICDPENGKCVLGCEKKFTGDFCDEGPVQEDEYSREHVFFIAGIIAVIICIAIFGCAFLLMERREDPFSKGAIRIEFPEGGESEDSSEEESDSSGGSSSDSDNTSIISVSD